MDLFTVDTVGDNNLLDENLENEDSNHSYSYDRTKANDSEGSDSGNDNDDEAEDVLGNDTVNVDQRSTDDEDEYDFELYGGE